MKLTFQNSLLNLLVGVLFLLAIILVFIDEDRRPWKDYQRAFNHLDRSLTEQERESLAELPAGTEREERSALLAARLEATSGRKPAIRQLWLQELDRIDRCTTCHQGVENARFAEAPQPFAAHPGNLLAPDRHPVNQFGCSVCHEGEGVALDLHGAHGGSHNFDKPLLTGATVEASCRKCHPFNEQVPNIEAFPEAAWLQRGKELYLANGCLGCHVSEGFSSPSRIGPELDGVGSKVRAAWLSDWLARPKDYLSRTIMPFFDLDDSQIERLSAYLLSRKSEESQVGSGEADQERGRVLFSEIGCLGCHTLEEEGDRFAPELSRVAEKLQDNWLPGWLADPPAYDRGTVMPDFRLEPHERRDISAYLLTLGEAAGEESSLVSGELIEEGRLLFRELGCSGCHSIEGRELGFLTPPHTGFADKRQDELDYGLVDSIPRNRSSWLQAKLKEPRAFETEKIKLLMPDFQFSADEIAALQTMVLSFTREQIPEAYRKPLWDLDSPRAAGLRVVEKFNCTGCHKMGLTPRETVLDDDARDRYYWSGENYLLEQLIRDDEIVGEPGETLSDRRLDALLAVDPEAENSLFRKRWFLTYDHVDYLQDYEFSTIQTLGRDEGGIIDQYADLNFAPPILHYEGIKVQVNWLADFLRSPGYIRPLTKATMPDFSLTQEEIDALVGLFVAKEELDTPHFPMVELASDQIPLAEKVFELCLQCHYFSQDDVLNKAQFGDLKGPNLARVARRLRPDYIKSWLKFPDLVIPGTQMKNFFYEFDIDSRFYDVLTDETGIDELSPDEKIEMMARFLMNPFKRARLSIER